DWEGPRLRKFTHSIVWSRDGVMQVSPQTSFRASYSNEEVEKVEMHFHPGATKEQWKTIFPKPAKIDASAAVIDLKEVGGLLSKMVEDASAEYVKKHLESPQEFPPVGRIELIFSLGDGELEPWVHLCFDKRENAEPDGEFSHPDFARLQFKSWLPAVA